MKTAAIYCRVSTEGQEKGIPSLQTQLEDCLAHCHGKGYEVAYQSSEAYACLPLERPELVRLRELVKSGRIDVLVVHTLDCLSHVLAHRMMLALELETYGVTLEAVAEDLNNLQLAQLISCVQVFVSKVAAESIRERIKRGKRAKARQ